MVLSNGPNLVFSSNWTENQEWQVSAAINAQSLAWEAISYVPVCQIIKDSQQPCTSFTRKIYYCYY